MKKIISAVFALCLAVAAMAADKDYKVVGYFPSWRAESAENYSWDMTHVNLSFATVNADGTLNLERVRKSNAAVKELCTKHGVRRMVSLGGGGPKAEQDAFAAAVVDPKARKALIRNVMKMVKELELDGVDIDYEAWSYDNDYLDKIQVGLEDLFVSLRKKLGKKRDLTSAICIPAMKQGRYTQKVIDSMSYLTVMAYDLTGPWTRHGGPHSPFEYALSGIKTALDAGAAPEQVVLGVPFYGYGFPNGESGDKCYSMTYAQIIRTYPGAENVDCINDELFYDGIPTIERKCQYVIDNKLGGIMFWELTQDSHDELSLLKTINRMLGR